MNKNPCRIAFSLGTALALLTATGCKTVVRENIVSHLNTGIGATITENPKTELYEVKLGFIRTQFYSIPTGKTVEGTNQSNAADVTPELVSGIRANSGAKHLFIGMDVSESFAVGKTAVMSPAAVAMYVANASSDAKAQAAAGAVGYASLDDPAHATSQSKLDGLLKKKLKPNTKLENKDFGENQVKEYADALADKRGSTLKTIRRKGGKDLTEIISELEKVVVP